MAHCYASYVHCTAPIFVAGPLSHLPRNLFHQSKGSQRFSQLFFDQSKASQSDSLTLSTNLSSKVPPKCPLLCLLLAENNISFGLFVYKLEPKCSLILPAQEQIKRYAMDKDWRPLTMICVLYGCSFPVALHGIYCDWVVLLCQYGSKWAPK